MTLTRSPRPLVRRLCRSVCREQGGKDAAVALVLAVVIGAAALQIGLGRFEPGRARPEVPVASLRT